MLDIVEPIKILEQGHCWLHTRARSTRDGNQQQQVIWEITVSQVPFTHSLHCLLFGSDGGFCLEAVERYWSWDIQPQFQVKGLLVIFPSISCIITANKYLAAVFQDVDKLNSLQFEPSVSPCVCSALSGFGLIRTLAEVNLQQQLAKIQINHIFRSWIDSWVLAGRRESSARIEAANIISYSTQNIIFCMQTYSYSPFLSLNYWVGLKTKVIKKPHQTWTDIIVCTKEVGSHFWNIMKS